MEAKKTKRAKRAKVLPFLLFLPFLFLLIPAFKPLFFEMCPDIRRNTRKCLGDFARFAYFACFAFSLRGNKAIAIAPISAKPINAANPLT